MNQSNHSIESEMRLISICWNEGKSIDSILGMHFYNNELSRIYEAIVKYGQFNTDSDFAKHSLDSDLFFKCIDTNAFSTSELPKLSSTLREMYFRREEIKKKQIEITELNDLKTDVSYEEAQDGFEDLIEEQADINAGMYKQLNTPWPILQHDSLFTEGKCITIICGDPGVGKSFFVTQLNLQFVVDGVKSIMWGAEDNVKFHTRRAIAQHIGDGRLCNYKYLAENNTQVMKIYVANKDIIDKIMNAMYSNKEPTRDALIKWCWAKAKEGYEVITIDPITFFSSNDKAHTADLEIMKALDEIRTKFGTRFIIVTHPKASEGSTISMDGIAGGKAMSRFAQVMLWIAKDKESSIRTVYTIKTRNGTKENGGDTAMAFNPISVCFEEMAIHNRMG